MSKEGLFLLSGDFISRNEIRHKHALQGDIPQFETPLPIDKDFNHWSARFRKRQEEYQNDVERVNSVEITLPDTSVINFIGDLHVGSPNVDYDRIAQEIETVVTTSRSYVMLMGDTVDGFFFNPAQMEQMEQPPEQFQYIDSLVSHLADNDKLLVGWSGDHCSWAKKMGNSAYSHFAQRAKAHYMEGLGFVTINIGDHKYRIAGAHRLPGHSMYSKTHPGKRAEKFGGARGADIIVHGHTHQKGYALEPVSEFGGASRGIHYISVGPYKNTDEYARKLGFSEQSEAQLFGSAVVLEKDRKMITYYDSILEANQ